MSLLIKYEQERSIFAGVITRLPNIKEALALDALNVIFQNLYLTSQRLEKNFLELSAKDRTLPHFINEEEKNSFLLQDETKRRIRVSSTIGDVWTLIDGIRRVERFFSFIPGQPSTKFKELLKSVKEVRDTFHHIDERINNHFSEIGDSIFGDVIWRFRPEKGERESLNAMISGSRLNPKEQPNLGQVQDIKFIDNVGVYDFNFVYIIREGGTYKKPGKHKKVIINLDEVVGVINEFILELEYYYSEFFLNYKETTSLDRSLPIVIGIRVKKK